MEISAPQPFDGGHFLPNNKRSRQVARRHRPAVDQHEAGAALAAAAAEAGAVEAQVVAQDVEQHSSTNPRTLFVMSLDC